MYDEQGVPGFVWAIFFILVALDISFAVVLFLQQSERGVFKSYLTSECRCLLLSLPDGPLTCHGSFFLLLLVLSSPLTSLSL